MTCLMFPCGDASWQPAADDVAALIVSAAALFVAPAAATVSRHPSASAHRTPSFLRLNMCSLPFGSWKREQPTPFPDARQHASGEDPVAFGLQASRPRGAEKAARLGLDEAHHVVHPVERRLRRVPRLLGAAREQALELDGIAAQ